MISRRKQVLDWEWYHFDGSVRQIDKGGSDFSILAGCIQSSCVPEREHGSHQLSETFGPVSVNIWSSLLKLVSCPVNIWEDGPLTSVKVVQFKEVPCKPRSASSSRLYSHS